MRTISRRRAAANGHSKANAAHDAGSLGAAELDKIVGAGGPTSGGTSSGGGAGGGSN
jgi:hypothetical protein